MTPLTQMSHRADMKTQLLPSILFSLNLILHYLEVRDKSDRSPMTKSRYAYVKNFETKDNLLPSTWIVVRIDGRGFHKFSDDHNFEKPNDAQALHLMNSCAAAVLEELDDIVFAYGVSDEYSFIFNKTTQLYQRSATKLMTITVSLFSSFYVMKWKQFFPHKDLKYTPCFDGRAICYPSTKILRDYLAWRQVDCHINNQYNTCFWMLVNSKEKMAKSKAQEKLRGTQTEQKNELVEELGIDYNKLPAMFRKGSSVFRNTPQMEVVIEHGDVIEDSFYIEHPWILGDEIEACKCRKASVSS